MRDGDVFKGDVELAGTLEKIGANAAGDGFTLCYEFCCVELRDDGFKDFVADRGEDALIVVEAEGLLWVGVSDCRMYKKMRKQVLA